MGAVRVGSALLAIFFASATLAQTGVPISAAEIEVPGGIAAVARLLGHVDQDPARFTYSLNQLLLSATTNDHDWQAIPLRRDLVRYLDLVLELERRFPAGTTLGPAGSERRALERLAVTVGFELVEDPRRGFIMLPRSDGDDDQAFRRAVAQALGLELERAGDRLAAGESWRLAIPRGRAASPLPAPLWEQVTGRPLGADALTVLAQDQRLGLLIEGLGALSSSTRAALDRTDLRWIYERAAFVFRRYASAFEIENGRLMAPGGDAALAMWRATVGASDASTEAMLRALLDSRRAKGAYLWHSLRFAPPRTVDYFTRGADTGGGLVRSIFDRLDEAGGAFDSSLATQPGFDALARSLPIDGDPPRLDLPGGPGLWLHALRDDSPQAGPEQASAIARQGEGRAVSDAELLLDLLVAKSGRPGPNTTVVPRFLRVVNLFSQHPALYSPETVVLAARGADLFAPALDLFDALELRSPQTARDYLSTVAKLRRLDLDWPREQLVMAFQGGSAWLQAMAAAGRVDPATLEQALSSWSAIHRGHADPGAAAPEELAWIVELLRRLPPAPEDAPGRGPLERAMVQALIAEVEPEVAWMGLDYAADRSVLAAAMVESLEFFEIPTADRLAEIHDSLGDLARRCRDSDLAAAKSAAAELRAAVASLPTPRALDAAAGGVERRIGNSERRELAALADNVLGRERANGLDDLAPRVERWSSHLAADLRPFLVAPAYVAALGVGRGPLLGDPTLVRRHRLVLENPTVERAWSEATVERGDDHAGTWITGHVGTVDGALSTFMLSTTRLRTSRGLDQQRARSWYHHLSATRWHRLDPALTVAVARIMDLGWAVLGIARGRVQSSSGGPELELAASIVPRGRLESAARTPPGGPATPAEALMVGMAALDRPSEAAAFDGAGDQLAHASGAVSALGPGWRQELQRAGLATPALNGKASPWLGWWPSYEAVELDGRNEALIERELVDLHLTVVAYLGRHGLPGLVGSDLMRHTIEDLAASVELGHERDWQSVLRVLGRMDDGYFEARFRECLSDGLYRLLEP